MQFRSTSPQSLTRMGGSPRTRDAERGGGESEAAGAAVAACGRRRSSSSSSASHPLPSWGGETRSKTCGAFSMLATAGSRASSSSSGEVAAVEEPSGVPGVCFFSEAKRQERGACPPVAEQPSDAADVSGVVTEAPASVFTGIGCDHHANAAATAVSSAASWAASGPPPPAAATVHIAANACPAAASAGAAPEDAGAAVASASSVDLAADHHQSQLQSLSDFSRSVGISEFVLGDGLAAEAPSSSAAAEAAAAGQAATDTATAARPPGAHALRGSLKTLYEDFQVYEHSYFPCMCEAQERLCSQCNNGGSSGSRSGRSDADSARSSSSNTKENSQSSSDVRWDAAAGQGLRPCAFGCWCTAFGGDKPLRLPYLVLPSDLLQQKQQQLLRESGAAHVCSSFSLRHCDAFSCIQQGDLTRSSSSSSKVAPGEGSSSDSKASDCSTEETSNSGKTRCDSNSTRDLPTEVESVVGGVQSAGGSDNCSSGSGGGEEGCCKEVQKAGALHGNTWDRDADFGKEEKMLCCAGAAAAAAEAAATQDVAASTQDAGCPFSALEIQNLEAFVRYLALCSRQHKAEILPMENLQLEQVTSQQEIMHQQQQQRRETPQQLPVHLQEDGPGQQEPACQCAPLGRNNSSACGAKEGGSSAAATPRSETRLLGEATQSHAKEKWGDGCGSCYCATAKKADTASWEVAALQRAAQAEEAAAGVAAVIAASKSCRRSSSSSISSDVGQDTLRSVERSQKSTVSENPFFEDGGLNSEKVATAEPVQQTQEKKKQLHGQQSRRKQWRGEAGKTQQQGERNGESAHQLQQRRQDKNAKDAGQRKRGPRAANERTEAFRPTLWVLGDLASCIFREMLGAEVAAAPDPREVVTARAGHADTDEREVFLPALVVTASTAAAAATDAAGFDVECGAAAAGGHDFSVSAAGGPGAPVCPVDKFFDAAAAACTEKSAPTLKELQKRARRSMHEFVHDKLPFLSADTLPLSDFLREEQRDEQQRRNQQQEDLQDMQGEDGDTQHDDEEAQGHQRKQLYGRVPTKGTEVRRWVLLRTHVPPGALPCVTTTQPVGCAAAEGRAAAAPSQDADSPSSSGSASADGSNAGFRRVPAVRPVLLHSVATAGCETVAVVTADETGKGEQEQFLKYFVSIAACVSQQCQALQQLLTLLQQQRQRLQKCLAELDEGQCRQLLKACPDMQSGGQALCSEKLRTRLTHNEEWVNLVTAALSALMDEEEQPHLLLMRLTPTPVCMQYLFPRRKHLLNKQKQQPLSRDYSTAAGRRGPALDTRGCLLSKRGFTEGNNAKAFLGDVPRLSQQGSPSAPFLHFVLLKINRDTAATLRLLEENLRQQRMLRNSTSSWASGHGRNGGQPAVNADFGIAAAGTKDKRGVTVQRCSANKTSPEALLEACYLGQQQRQRPLQMQQQQEHKPKKHRQQPQHSQARQLQQPATEFQDELRESFDTLEDEQLPLVFVAPLGYYSRPQWLGGLRGNFFQVIIRNLRPAADAPPCCGGAVHPQADHIVQVPAAGKSAVFGGATAAAAATTATGALMQNRQGTSGMESPVAKPEGGRRESAEARPAAPSAVAFEKTDALPVASTYTPPALAPIQTSADCSAQAADDVRDLHNTLCVSSMGAKEQATGEPRQPEGVRRPGMFAPLSACEKEVQQLGAAVCSSMSSFRSLGFLNYYGLQRFGTHAVRTYEVGAALLREDWAAAVAGVLGEKGAVRHGAAASHKAATRLQATAATEGAAVAGSTERSTICEGTPAKVTEKRPADSDCVVIQGSRVSAGIGKQLHTRMTDSSPWEVLQRDGPEAALESLARHQHIERTILSALLRQCPLQGQAPHAHSALNRKGGSACSSSVGSSRLSSFSAASLTRSSSVGSALPSSDVCVAASTAAPDSEQSTSSFDLCPLDARISSPDAPSAGCSPAEKLQQETSPIPAGELEGSAVAQKARVSHAIKHSATECYATQQGTAEGGSRPEQLPALGDPEQERRQPGSVVHSISCSSQEASPLEARLAGAALLESPTEPDREVMEQGRRSKRSGESAFFPTSSGGTTAGAAAERVTVVAGQKCASAAQPCNLRNSVQVVQRFQASPTMYLRALREVAPTSLQLYLHAAQSVLFNFACSWRWRTYGPRVRVGDFVCDRSAHENSTPELCSKGFPSSKQGSSYDDSEAGPAHRRGPREAEPGIDTVDVDAGDLRGKSWSYVGGEKAVHKRGTPDESWAHGYNAQSSCNSRPLEGVSCARVLTFDDRSMLRDHAGNGGEDGTHCRSKLAEPSQLYYNGQPVRRIQNEEEANKASIHDVVLPLAGTDVEYPADLLQVYQQLSREILGVELEAFQKFNAVATQRGCFSAGRKRHAIRKKRSRPASAREIYSPIISKCGRTGKGSITLEARSTISSCFDSMRNDKSGCAKDPGSGREVGAVEIDEEQLVDRGSVPQTSETCCETDRDADCRRLGVDRSDSSATAQANSPAEDVENLDTRSLGVSCKGGFRPLLVRPRCCSWQLLRVGVDPDSEPKPLLLSDVDLLLRRRLAAQRGVCEDRVFLKENVVQPQNLLVPPHQTRPQHLQWKQLQRQRPSEAGQGDFRVSWDDELSSDVVRCIPEEEHVTDKVVSGVKMPQHDGATKGPPDRVGSHDKSAAVCGQEEPTRIVATISGGGRPKGSSFSEEPRKLEYKHQKNAREAQRTDLVVRGERSNYCLLLRFWLPAGCYFTMALREVMKVNAPDEDGAAFAGARLQNVTSD